MKCLQRGDFVARLGQIRQLDIFECTGIAGGCQSRIHRQLGENVQIVFLGNLIHMAFAEYGDVLAAVRTYYIAVVFDDAGNGGVEQLIISAILTALVTTMDTSSCGEVMTMMPSTGRD